MEKKLHLLGFDYGASNGRAILGVFDGKKLKISEIHRFPNEPVQMGDRLYWDFPRLFAEMRRGLLKCAQAGIEPDVIGVDTWGVDFGLLDGNGRLLGNPVHYRETMTNGMMDEAFRAMPKEEIFEHTGLAFMQFNSLYQLLALKKENDAALASAKALLFMPDLFTYFLTGVKGSEYSIASTAQLTDPRTRDWSPEIFERFGLPHEIFQPIHESGRVRGPLSPALCAEFGFKKAPLVVAVAQHDTAAAVASVPCAQISFKSGMRTMPEVCVISWRTVMRFFSSGTLGKKSSSTLSSESLPSPIACSASGTVCSTLPQLAMSKSVSSLAFSEKKASSSPLQPMRTPKVSNAVSSSLRCMSARVCVSFICVSHLFSSY